VVSSSAPGIEDGAHERQRTHFRVLNAARRLPPHTQWFVLDAGASDGVAASEGADFKVV
jgi:hypothetical protein